MNKFIIDIDVIERVRLEVEADTEDDAVSKAYSMPAILVLREGSSISLETNNAECIEEIDGDDAVYPGEKTAAEPAEAAYVY